MEAIDESSPWLTHPDTLGDTRWASTPGKRMV